MVKILAALSLVGYTVSCAPPAPSAEVPLDGVVVTRRALTVSMVLDTVAAMGKAGATTAGWQLRIIRDIYNHSSWLWLEFAEPFSAAAYRVAVKPAKCRVLTDTYSCRDSATIQVANGRLLITVRDSAMLALLFGDRPTRVAIVSSLPRHTLRSSDVVSYVDPQILPPSRNALAEYDRALGRDGWSPWTRVVRIGSPYGATDTVLMHVGDIAGAGVTEEQFRPVDVFNHRSDFTASGWTTSDSSVVSLAPSNAPPLDIRLIARKAGRSSVTVHGLRGPSDELPRSPRVRTLTRHIVVTNRLARVAIAPRPREIVAGTKLQLAARAIDIKGGVAEGVPVEFFVIYDVPDQHGWDGKKFDRVADADLTTPGRVRFLARFATFADTLDVQVVPRKAPAPPEAR